MKNKPITILFDGSPLVNGKKSGVGYYTYRLLDALATNYPDELTIKVHFFNFLGRKENLDLPGHPNITYVQSRIMPGKVLNLARKLGFQLPLELLFKSGGDVALFPNFVGLPSILHVPKIIAVHDLCFEDVPEYVAEGNRRFLQKFVPHSVRSATRIITISRATKRSIIKHYAVPEEKIVITPIPPSSDTSTKEIRSSIMRGHDDYILFVGTLEPRKNLGSLVKGYVSLPQNIKSRYPLVLAGAKGWQMEETLVQIKKHQANGENIVLTGYVSDNERSWLYKHASVFVLPSHYEGFGMPILEAMQYGTPTVVSNIPVFHEVGANASSYFDENDPISIRDSIKKVLEDKALRSKMIKQGQDQASKYNWSHVAKTVYDSLSGI